MPRDIPVGNGNLLLTFDLHYRIRDVYYPWIGQENHGGGNEFRFGIWADGRLSWMGPDWDIDLRYRDDTLVTQVSLRNVALGLELRCQDAVDVNLNVYVRLVEVIDLEDRARDVRLFFGHDFRLYGNEVGDTAYFDPRSHCIVHYKANRYFLVGCCGPDGTVTDAFSCVPGRHPGRIRRGKTPRMGSSPGVRSRGVLRSPPSGFASVSRPVDGQSPRTGWPQARTTRRWRSSTGSWPRRLQPG